MEGKVAALGDSDFVMPFSALGLDTFVVSDKAEDIVNSAKEILTARYALVVIAENIAPAAQEVFETASQKPIPCVVTVPFTTESGGFATEALGKLLKMATGIDILQNN